MWGTPRNNIEILCKSLGSGQKKRLKYVRETGNHQGNTDEFQPKGDDLHLVKINHDGTGWGTPALFARFLAARSVFVVNHVVLCPNQSKAFLLQLCRQFRLAGGFH